jgi:hypothetical protein
VGALKLGELTPLKLLAFRSAVASFRSRVRFDWTYPRHPKTCVVHRFPPCLTRTLISLRLNRYMERDELTPVALGMGVMPRRSILSLIPGTNIVGPPRRLHKQHKTVIGNGNVLEPRLPLLCVPGMLLQDCFDPVHGPWILLLENLVSDGSREHMAGNIPGRRGKG